MQGATKSQTSSQLYNLMRMDSQSTTVETGYKDCYYRGYTIRVYDELVPDKGNVCVIIDPSGENLAHRRGLELAIAFVDSKEAHVRKFKVKVAVPETKPTIVTRVVVRRKLCQPIKP